MGQVLPTITVDTYMPSIGALLGTSASSDLIHQLNDQYGQTYIGEEWSVISNNFMRDIVRPIRQEVQQLKALANRLHNPDEIRPLVTQEDFISIPPCMQMVILTHPGVRELHRKGRISGFGYDPEDVPVEDMYGRIIENGLCRDVGQSLAETGQVTLHWDMHDDDPDYNVEQVEALDATRRFLDRLYEDTDLDPTDIKNIRG